MTIKIIRRIYIKSFFIIKILFNINFYVILSVVRWKHGEQHGCVEKNASYK